MRAAGDGAGGPARGGGLRAEHRERSGARGDGVGRDAAARAQPVAVARQPGHRSDRLQPGRHPRSGPVHRAGRAAGGCLRVRPVSTNVERLPDHHDGDGACQRRAGSGDADPGHQRRGDGDGGDGHGGAGERRGRVRPAQQLPDGGPPADVGAGDALLVRRARLRKRRPHDHRRASRRLADDVAAEAGVAPGLRRDRRQPARSLVPRRTTCCCRRGSRRWMPRRRCGSSNRRASRT